MPFVTVTGQNGDSQNGEVQNGDNWHSQNVERKMQKVKEQECIQCDGCQCWMHHQCTDMTLEQYFNHPNVNFFAISSYSDIVCQHDVCCLSTSISRNANRLTASCLQCNSPIQVTLLLSSMVWLLFCCRPWSRWGVHPQSWETRLLRWISTCHYLSTSGTMTVISYVLYRIDQYIIITFVDELMAFNSHTKIPHDKRCLIQMLFKDIIYYFLHCFNAFYFCVTFIWHFNAKFYLLSMSTAVLCESMIHNRRIGLYVTFVNCITALARIATCWIDIECKYVQAEHNLMAFYISLPLSTSPTQEDLVVDNTKFPNDFITCRHANS